MRPIHIIGGGLAGSEAAWQAANSGVPVVLHEMRPIQTTAAHRTPHLAELVCSNSFRSDDASTNAVGILHREMRALGSIILQSADAHQVPAGGALAVDRDGFSQAVEAALLSHPLITLDRGEIAGLPPEDWDNVIVATGPLTSPALAEAIGRIDRRGRARLFRRDRADRAPPFDQYGRGVDAVALRQGRARRGRRGLRQLPDEPRPVRGVHRRASRGREDRVSRIRGHALFRRLPADRSHGRARPRDPAPRADEAGRAHQRARSDGQALCRGPAPAGQCARHAVQHRRLPDQAQIWRAGPDIPHDSGARRSGVRPARRHAPQHLSQFPSPARRPSPPEGCARACASPARSPAAKAMSKAPRSASSPGASPPPSGSGKSSSRRRRPPRSARSSITSPAATSNRSTPARARSSR